MIWLFFLVASANPTWSTHLDQLENTATTLKSNLQELQDYSSVPVRENIPVASILSVYSTIDTDIKKIQKQINQMDKLLK